MDEGLPSRAVDSTRVNRKITTLLLHSAPNPSSTDLRENEKPQICFGFGDFSDGEWVGMPRAAEYRISGFAGILEEF